MNNISPIGRAGISALETTTDTIDTMAAPKEAMANQGRDQVEISAAGHLLSRLEELPDVRHELVERVRSQIQAGTYESEEKVSQAIDELIIDLVG